MGEQGRHRNDRQLPDRHWRQGQQRSHRDRGQYQWSNWLHHCGLPDRAGWPRRGSDPERRGQVRVPEPEEHLERGPCVTSIPANNALSIVDPPKSAKIAYPISTFTYAIVPKNTTKVGLLTSFIDYALTTGQQFGAKIDFAPIPSAVLNRAKATLAGLT